MKSAPAGARARRVSFRKRRGSKERSLMLDVRHPDLRSLYRSFIRQIRQLPTDYLRHFFRIKVRDDIRTLSHPNVHNHDSKVKRVVKELRRITAANNRDKKAFDHVLDLAYGRKGKLRWELIKPLLTDPSAPLPDPIIAQEESSRPPVFSPELKALLTSPYSHTSRPLTVKAIERPPSLPERANPDSEEAQLVGPFSKRREVNIRWRFFTSECKKLRAPLHVIAQQNDKTYASLDVGHDSDALARAGIRGFGLQDTNVLDEIRAMAGPPYKSCSTMTSPADSSKPESSGQLHDAAAATTSRPLTNRFIRRRYQELLARTPILTYAYRKDGDEKVGLKYDVSLDPRAISHQLLYSSARIPEVDQANMEWIEAANRAPRTASKKKN